MSKKVIVLLAEGFEEIEALTPVDYLRRAGIEVVTAVVGLGRGGDLIVKGARGISVIADTSLEALMQGRQGLPWDAVVLPGGMPGASNLAASAETGALLKEMAAANKWVCAICASPAVVLGPLGLLQGKRFTCYPDMETQVKDGKWSAERVVVDADSAGGIITSRGAGTAGEFAAAIISCLLGEAEGTKVARSVLLQM